MAITLVGAVVDSADATTNWSAGNISTDDSHQTNIPGIFSAGDAATGASLVVTAIKKGRAAAESINNYLV